MIKHLSTNDLGRDIAGALAKAREGERCVVTRYGHPIALLAPLADLETLEKLPIPKGVPSGQAKRNR